MTPTKPFLCGVNYAAFAGLTASVAAESSLPLSNLQVSAREDLWRQINAAEVDIKLEWSASVSERLNFVALWRHNFEGGATVRIRGYSTYDWTGSTVYDSGLIDPAYDTSTLGALDFGVDVLGISDEAFLNQRLFVHYFLENTDVINSLKITINDTGNSDGYLEASLLFTGRGVELELGAVQASISWEEDTEQSRTDGGSLQSDGTISWREVDIDCNIDATQRAELMDVFRVAGKLRDLFFALYPSDDEEAELRRDYTLLCRFRDKPKVTSDPDQEQAQIFKTKMAFGEL